MNNKKPETSGISLVLFFVFLIGLFLETTSTIMAADTSASKIIVDGEEILPAWRDDHGYTAPSH